MYASSSTGSSTSSTASSSDLSAASPSARRRNMPAATHIRRRSALPIGVDPAALIGKVLRTVRRSRDHPAVTLHFADNTTYQIRVDGYDPVHRGIPKELEMDPALEPLFNPPDGKCDVDLTIRSAAIVTLTDKAFELRERESRWDQHHAGIALKFEEEGRWHCVWASLAEYDPLGGKNGQKCVFRSYNDVYLDTIRRPEKRSVRGTRHKPSNGV